MTRFARSTKGPARSVDALLHARWRVGLHGSLELRLSPRAGTRDRLAAAPSLLEAGVEAVLEVTLEAKSVLDTARWTLLGTLQETDCETRFTVDSVVEAENGSLRTAPEALLGATLTLCEPSDGSADDAALLLTDLPQRLGLMGGTYVLESIRACF